MMDSSISKEQANRIADSMISTIIFKANDLGEVVAKHCESPIETMLATAVLLLHRVWRMWPNFGGMVPASSVEQTANDQIILIPQYEWREYRIDFAFRVPALEPPWVFVECDGHNFHERTKEQAARDRARDREIQQAGIPVLRFTGSEIFRDPTNCAGEVLVFIEERLLRSAPKQAVE